MAQFRAATLILDNQTYELAPGRINSFDTFYVDFQYTANGPNEAQYLLFLHPKQDVLAEKVSLSLHFPRGGFGQVTTFGLNSAQGSATFSLDHNNVQNMGLYEDDPFALGIPVGKGLLHSWSYLHFEGPKQQLWCSSGNESAGFTSVLYDIEQEVLTFSKDLGKGMRVTHSFPALDVRIGAGVPSQGDTYPVFRGILAMQEGASLEALKENLESIKAMNLPFTHFLIPEGWAAQMGDWLGGQAVQGMLGEIRKQGLEPVLPLSPFAVSTGSDLARRNPDWLLLYQGKPMAFPTDSGQLAYALDVFHGGVREYLSGVFHLYHERLGIGCFQLENLFAACLVPKPEKTRGQIMHEALSLLRQLGGGARLIGCHVPLGAAAGHLDAVRMGEPPFQKTKDGWSWKHRDCLRPVRSLVAAQALRGKLWSVAGQHTAVWPTKDKKSASAQYSFLVANALLSDLLYLPCPQSVLSPELTCELEGACQLHRSSGVEVSQANDQVLRIGYVLEGMAQHTLLNLSGKEETVGLGGGVITLDRFECW